MPVPKGGEYLGWLGGTHPRRKTRDVGIQPESLLPSQLAATVPPHKCRDGMCPACWEHWLFLMVLNLQRMRNGPVPA